MAKFIIPPGVVKVPAAACSHSSLWPIGTLFHHVASNTYFRFLKLGHRWDTHYAISTDRGIFAAGMVGGKREYRFDAQVTYSQVSMPTKQQICEMLLAHL